MASFPLLFGAPSFGSEDRDQWIRVLTLFLQDPFKPQASIVNGAMQVNYQYSIPGESITGTVPGSAIWRNNAHGIRELNESPEKVTLADTASQTISDRPGVVFAYNSTDEKPAIYHLYGSSGTANAVGIGGFFGPGSWDFPGTAGTIGIGPGTGGWVIENNLGYDVDVYLCVVSLGPQI